jgi:hypothetical protein
MRHSWGTNTTSSAGLPAAGALLAGSVAAAAAAAATTDSSPSAAAAVAGLAPSSAAACAAGCWCTGLTPVTGTPPCAAAGHRPMRLSCPTAAAAPPAGVCWAAVGARLASCCASAAFWLLVRASASSNRGQDQLAGGLCGSAGTGGPSRTCTVQPMRKVDRRRHLSMPASFTFRCSSHVRASARRCRDTWPWHDTQQGSGAAAAAPPVQVRSSPAAQQPSSPAVQQLPHLLSKRPGHAARWQLPQQHTHALGGGWAAPRPLGLCCCCPAA